MSWNLLLTCCAWPECFPCALLLSQGSPSVMRTPTPTCEAGVWAPEPLATPGVCPCCPTHQTNFTLVCRGHDKAMSFTDLTKWHAVCMMAYKFNSFFSLMQGASGAKNSCCIIPKHAAAPFEGSTRAQQVCTQDNILVTAACSQ